MEGVVFWQEEPGEEKGVGRARVSGTCCGWRSSCSHAPSLSSPSLSLFVCWGYQAFKPPTDDEVRIELASGELQLPSALRALCADACWMRRRLGTDAGSDDACCVMRGVMR